MRGTFIGTLAAARAEGLVDVGDVIVDGNGMGGANLGADTATDTARVAHFLDDLALLLGEASDSIACCRGKQLDEVVGTSRDALTAGAALVVDHLCTAADDMDGVKGTGLDTATQTDTSVGAGFVASPGNQCGTVTIAIAVILIDKACFLTATRTFNKGYTADGFHGILPHDGRDLIDRFLVTAGTSIDGSVSFGNGGRESITARITASAAITAREAFADGLGFFIGGDCQKLARNAEEYANHHAESGNDTRGYEDGYDLF